MKSRQIPFSLYWRVENVQFWINSIGHLGWLSCISNFPRFHKNVNSMELWKYISENSSPKGSFWRNKKNCEFSELSWDSPYLLAVALKISYERTGSHRTIETRAFKNFNHHNFLDDVAQQPWNKIFSETNPEAMWDVWKDLFMEVVDRHAQLQNKRVSNKHSPWIT